jgi:hypothetical protein
MRHLFFSTLFLSAAVAFSQNVPVIKFGKITEADFKNKTYAIDTGVNAVVLADVGSTQIKGNKKGWFSLEYKHLLRIHILKNSGYNKATVEIPLYTEGELEEELNDLKAVTYNLENGKVVETKLNVKTSVFREKIDKNTVIKKFTFPNVKEGSVIEYELTLSSDFLFNIQPWIFQGDIPHLWSQYTVSVPQFLNYTLIPQGNLSYYLTDRKDKDGSYMVDVQKEVAHSVVNDRIQISCGISDFRWAMKDIPAFKEEPFTSSLGNYVAKLEFQLAGYLAPLTEEKILTTWPDMMQRLLKREDFGVQLETAANWLPSVLKPIIQGAATETEKARKIYKYVRDNFTCTDQSQLFTESSLEKVANKKNGGVAEINLLLIAMLRNAGLQAEPVILSTRDHGFVYEQYPVASRFNYVICRAKVDGKEILLDASRPRMGFGRLHYDCYNGQARVVNEDATILSLKPDQLTENRQTSIFIYNEPNGKWSGHASKLYGYYASDKIRQKISADGNAGLMKELNTEYGSELKIDSLRVDSILNTDEPVTVYFEFKHENEQQDILYVNPVMGEHLTQNPFKSANRQYPVEMPYKLNELYSLSMEIPEGYVVDELPKSVTIKLNSDDDDVVFQYKISKSEKNVLLNYKLAINQPFFYPAEYNSLREFFNNVVAKMDEQVVFKRKAK